MLAPAIELGLGGEIAPEDGRERPAIGQTEEAERSDRHVKVQRINAGAKDALLRAALEQDGDLLGERGIEREDARGALEELGAMQIFRVEQAQEFGMREIVVPGEQDEIADRLDGVAVRQAQGMLRRADRDIRAFEHGDIERFLVAEVVIPVSYTHLDVYKRQGSGIRDARDSSPR